MPLNDSELLRRLQKSGLEVRDLMDAAAVDEDYTVPRLVRAVAVDTSAGPVTVTLPADPTAGQRLTIKKVTSNANTLTINGNGRLVDGQSSIGTGATIDLVACHLWYWDSAWHFL